MKLSILRDGLLSLVGPAQSAVARHSSLPVLKMLKIEAEDGQGSEGTRQGVTVTGTCLELTLAAHTTQAQIQEGGVAVVGAASFAEFLSALPSQMVRLETTPSGLSIECQGSKARFHTVPAGEFPEARTCPDVPPLLVDAAALREAVKRCAPVAATDEARPVLCGLHLVSRGSELHVEASDGFRLAVCKVPITVPGEFEALVNARMLETAARHWGESVVALRADAGKTLFVESDDLRGELSMLDGVFPDVSNFLRMPAGHASCEVEVSDLVGALRAARVLQDGHTQCLRLWHEEGGIRLTTQDDERGDAACGVPAQWLGKQPYDDVALVSRYLQHALSGLTDKVLLSWGTSEKQIVVQSTDGATWHAIMPLQIRR